MMTGGTPISGNLQMLCSSSTQSERDRPVESWDIMARDIEVAEKNK